MDYGEACRIRKEIVDGIRPEWMKVKRNPWDMAANEIPDAPGAREYWRARNASSEVMRHLANEQEDLNVRLARTRGYSTHMPDSFEVAQAHVMERARQHYLNAVDELEAATLARAEGEGDATRGQTYRLVSFSAAVPVNISLAVPGDMDPQEALSLAAEHAELGHGPAAMAFADEMRCQVEDGLARRGLVYPQANSYGEGWALGDQTGSLDVVELSEADLAEIGDRVPGFVGALAADGRLVEARTEDEVER